MLEASVCTVTLTCFSSCHGRKPDQESKKRHSIISFLRGPVIRTDREREVFFWAREMAWKTLLENSFAAGTSKAKEVVLPANFWRVLRDTELRFNIDSRRAANFNRLSSGRMNAYFSESHRYPRKRTTLWGSRSPMK